VVCGGGGGGGRVVVVFGGACVVAWKFLQFSSCSSEIVSQMVHDILSQDEGEMTSKLSIT
jgi:hypothetical protein